MMTNQLALRLRIALCSAFGVSLAACAGGTSTATPAPATVVRVDTATADPELEQRVATLQLRLLERTAQVDDVQRQLDGTRQEVVRAMSRLQTFASRAEAASAMAEAEIGVASLTEAAGEAPESTEARDLLMHSQEEFADENYGGALYLASQARHVTRTFEVRLTSGGQESLRPTEVLFVVPVPLETARRSNVRSGPGLGFRILRTLDTATPLVGHSYTEEWVRIKDDQGRDGWIFQNLVTSP